MDQALAANVCGGAISGGYEPGGRRLYGDEKTNAAKPVRFATQHARSAHAGDIVSEPTVVLRNNAIVHGTLITGGVVDPQDGAQVLGQTQESANIPLQTLRLSYELPANTLPGMTISPDSEHTADPDTAYGAMNVHSRAVLHLGAGDYHFQGLAIEPEATLDIDNAAGAVRVFVHGAFTFQGNIVYSDAASANTLFAVTGNQGVDVDAPFVGTILAPNAPLDLISTDRGHAGVFWAASVTANPHTIITHRPFGRNDCDTVDDGCGTVPGCPATKVCPTEEELDSVRPTVDCVIERDDGSLVGVFGYENDLDYVVRIPIGEDNSFDQSLAGQLTIFQPGAHRREFYVGFTDMTAWTLGNHSASVSPSNPRCDDIIEALDPPIRLVGSRDLEGGVSSPGSESVSTPISFEIPDRLRVTAGGAGNGSAVLTFVDDQGQNVTCSYRGGSRVAEPIYDLDRALGRSFLFESCDDGSAAGEVVRGTSWNVGVLGGDPTFTHAEVTVPVGPGCSVLNAPIAADTSVLTRQAFSWQLTEALPVNDPDGLPAMRYAWIYIEDEAQLQRLSELGVYVRHMPIFTSDLQKYEGRCGLVDSRGDGNGVFVHAFVLAELYNLFRAQALTALNAGQGNVPLRVIHLPEIPVPELRNADGTLDWAKAYEVGLDVLPPPTGSGQPLFGVHVPVVDDAIQATEDTAQIAWDAIGGPQAVNGVSQIIFGDEVLPTEINLDPSFSDVLNTGVDIVVASRERLHQIAGEIDKFINGSVNATFRVQILNRDAFFGLNNPLRRSWGPLGVGTTTLNTPFVNDGAKLEVWKTTSATGFDPALLPVSFFGTLGQDSEINMQVSRSGRSLGLCFHLENDAAVVADDLFPDVFCNFRVDISFEQTVDLDLRLSDFKLHTHALLTDSYHFARATIPGFIPPQADVNAGELAQVVTRREPGIIAPENPTSAVTVCLNFPEVADLVSVAGFAASGLSSFGLAGGELGLTAWNHATKDMFLARGGNVDLSRGVVPHEYGHFLMCALTYEQSPSALLGLIRDRIEPRGERPEVEVVFEAFADFFASQVTSGTNYAKFFDGAAHVDAVASGGMEYCVGRLCIESGCGTPTSAPGALCRGRFAGGLSTGISAGNYRGGAAEPPTFGGGADLAFYSEVRRLVTLFHDTVDRPTDAWRTVPGVPTNVDAWQRSTVGSASLTAAPLGFQRDGDDDVALGLEVLREWIRQMYGSCDYPILPNPLAIPGDCLANVNRAQHSLDSAMELLGVNWCDRCEVFALHDPSAAARTANSEPQQWAACLGAPLSGIVGPPPDASLRLRASDCQPCPPGQTSDLAGNCVACDPGSIQIGNGCFPCGPGFISNPATNTCVPCGPGGVSDPATNTCVTCPDGLGVDPATNTCIECIADVTASLVAVDSCHTELQGYALSAQAAASAPPPAGDNCPGTTWVEFRNLQALSAPGAPEWEEDFVFEAEHIIPPTLAECAGSTLTYDVFVPGAVSGTWNHVGHVDAVGGSGGILACSFDSDIDFFVSNIIAAGIDRIRLRGQGFNNGVPVGLRYTAQANGVCPP